MKKKLLILVSLAILTFTGCSCAKVETVNEQNTAEETSSSMFVEVENTSIWKVVYHKDTKVMYTVSYSGYNSGNFTLLVNPDGTPMVYEGDK